jgi:hypothetical protein
VIPDLGNLAAGSIDNVNQPSTDLGFPGKSVNCNRNHEAATSMCFSVEKMKASVMIFSELVLTAWDKATAENAVTTSSAMKGKAA